MNGDAKVPFKTHSRDFCYDVVATSKEEVSPGVFKYGVGLGFQMEFPKGFHEDDMEDIIFSLDFRPRSSIYKTGLVLANSTATIDEPFTGQVFLIFYHVMPNLPEYEVGDRIAQVKVGMTMPVEWVVVDKLDETERGDGGFGSTGR